MFEELEFKRKYAFSEATGETTLPDIAKSNFVDDLLSVPIRHCQPFSESQTNSSYDVFSSIFLLGIENHNFTFPALYIHY